MNLLLKAVPLKLTFNKVANRFRLLPRRAIPFVPIAMVVLPLIRLIRPWILIRWGGIVTHALGHFALNTELYLCERDRQVNRPKQKYVDLPFLPDLPVCNAQLLKMWKRVINTYPASPLEAIEWVNNVVPGGAAHNIGANVHNDRDILNLMAGTKPHLSFTDEEEERGRRFLESLGIKDGTPYICLNVRDAAYYNAVGMQNARHAFRDSSIENYVLAAEALVDRGFVVLRMGREVETPLVSARKKIVDYAYRQMGDEFMDVYLGANCYMCLSTGSGFDAIPAIFRRPVSYVNLLPIEAPASSQTYHVYLGKAHLDVKTGKQLSFREIVDRNFVYGISTEAYLKNGISLKENSPEEILDVAIETIERMQGTWIPDPVGERLQDKFRQIMPLSLQDSIGRPMHGEFFIRYSENYLKKNPWWVE